MADKAYENIKNPIPGLLASGDLSTKQFYIVKMHSTDLQVAVAGNAEQGIGVLQNKPSAAGRAAEVSGIGDVTKVLAGDTLTVGARIGSDTDGKAVPAASGDYILGICLIGAAAGEYATMLQHGGSSKEP